VALSVQSVAAMAPDQASLDAARKLLKLAQWPVLGTDSGLAWGECQGSGSAPYRISLSVEDLGYKCSCPSRKFPCKHVLALMWFLADKPADFARATAPDWVSDWAAKRKPRAAPAADRPNPAIVTDIPIAEPERDEKAEARAAAQRERVRAAREESILNGLDELDLWLADRLEAGLSGFAAIAYEQCRLLARRLNDAKAPGLALIVDQLPATLLSLPQGERIGWLIEALGRLQLIAAAYRRQALLPPALRDEVRRIVGWTVERGALLDDQAAMSVTAVWRVIGTLSEVQVDGLRRLETWLMRTDAAPQGEPQFALLLDFVPVSQGTSTSFLPGEIFKARLVFYPSTAPLRAIIAERLGETDTNSDLPADATLGAAITRYHDVLVALPFVDRWPLAMRDVTIADTVSGLVLAAGDGSVGLPLTRAQEDDALLLVGRRMTAAGVWNGRSFHLLAAETGIGPWYQEARR
jgi:hypothetical protein